MKDLLEKILAYLPGYIPDIVGIVSNPRRFIARRNQGSERNLIKAITFLGISISISAILQAPIAISGKDFATDAASHAILYILFVIIFSAILRFSWRIVGGKADYYQFLITSSYYAGVITIGLAIAALCFIGVLKVFYHESYIFFMKIAETSNFHDVIVTKPDILWGILIASLVFLTLILPALMWGFIGWRVFCQLNQLSRFRSYIALFLTFVFSLLVIGIEMMIALAI
jgi:hypothetical protein